MIIQEIVKLTRHLVPHHAEQKSFRFVIYQSILMDLHGVNPNLNIKHNQVLDEFCTVKPLKMTINNYKFKSINL